MPEPVRACLACGREYQRRMLRCPGCETIGVQFLYKYCRFDEYSLSSLADRATWFPTVASLNDPFEFSFALRDMEIDGVPIDVGSLEQARADIKRYGVLSLSEINNDILMWSHYAGAHSGYCLQFERREDN